MNDTKYTPGPWHVSRLPKGPRGGGGGLALWFSNITFLLAPDTPQVEADLRVAAAAPELLSALQGLFEHCAMIHKHWGEGSNAQAAQQAIEHAKAAIARAEGDTQ